MGAFHFFKSGHHNKITLTPICNGHGLTQDYQISVREAYIKTKLAFVVKILYYKNSIQFKPLSLSEE